MKKSKKTERIVGASLVDIPANAQDRLEIILEASGAGGTLVQTKKISIGLDDGGGCLSSDEAKRLSEVILEMSRPKFKERFGDCYYQVNLFVNGERYILIAPNVKEIFDYKRGENDESKWKLVPFDETPLPF
jgi:hypothetical protein